MKKAGNYLMSALPFIGMLAIQVVVAVMITVYDLLAYGFEKGLQMYEEQMTVTLAMSHLLTVGFMGLWYYLEVHRRRKKAGVKRESRLTWRSLGGFVVLAVGGQFLCSLILNIWGILAPQSMASYTELLEAMGLGEVTFFSVLAGVILAPIGEELVFRGLTMEYLRRAGAGFLAANVLQSLLFAAAHLNFVQGSYAFFVGFICGYAVYRYGTVWAGIAVHLAFNLYGIVIQNVIDFFVDVEANPSFGTGVLASVLYFVFGAAMILGGLYLLQKDLGEERGTGRKRKEAGEKAEQERIEQKN